MPREDWRNRYDYVNGPLRGVPHDDFGQADYSVEYGYDPARRSGFRAVPDGPRASAEYGQTDSSPGSRGPQPRSFDAPRTDVRGRREPSDRVLWAVIAERLEDQHRLDLSGVELRVDEGEVTLNGTVRHKADRRRIEDIADIEGVRHVQNNLRVRHRSWF